MTAGVADAGPALGLAEDARAATAVLVREHFRFVWRTLRRFGVPEADADDAAQRVFLIVSQKLSHIEPGRERGFLFGTAVRVADKVRRAASRHPVALLDDLDALPSALPSPDQLVDQRRARDLLDAALAALSDDLRAVFVLYEIEQLTSREIAEVLEIPHGTVASRLRRAREAFTRSLPRIRKGETP